MSETLRDEEVRTAAATDLQRTMFVEAGAGTGKTTMLIARIVQLITTRTARLDEIAAITFTEAAAAELRDRLLQELEEWPDPEDEEAVREAVSALDGAAITTLHGFARRILAEHPFAVGLPPVFEVADASGSRVAFDERWDDFVAQLLDDPAHVDLVVRALSCGLSWPQLRRAARQCEENWDLLEPAPGGSPPPAIDTANLMSLLQTAVDMESACCDSGDKLLAHLISKVRPSINEIGGAEGAIDLLQVLVGLPKLSNGNAGQAANWKSANGMDHKSDVQQLLEQAEAERWHLIDDTVQWVMRELFSLLVSFTLTAAEERRVSGRLIFHDLLVLARNLVRDDAEARHALHERYTHVLIDEFQDTDPIQAELAMYLASGSGSPNGGGAWPDLPVDPGRLFFVGDPKQSIYRFRRADIEVFMTTRDRVVGHADQLVTNFRSRPAIVEWINTVFGAMFGAGDPGRQPGYEPLVADEDRGTDNSLGLRPVIVLGQEPIEAKVDQVRETRAAEVAHVLATMHAEGWQVRHGKAAPSPMTFSDVAILVPTRTGLDILEEGLRTAGVPFRLESSSLVYQSQEVREVLAILRAIDDPTDAVSAVAALRSPAFGCGDDDLLQHVRAGGRWDSRVPSGQGVAAEGLAALREYHEQRWWHGVSALVGDVVTDRRLMPLALAHERPRESWRRIRFLLDQARAFDEGPGGDLRAFLRWVGHQQEEDARVTEVILPESDDDAVRISTVHAVKGLEFPITVLLGVPKGRPNDFPALLFGAQPELYFNKNFATPGYEEMYQAAEEMDHFERIRLLYVAATRACDVLLVCLHRKAEKTPSLDSVMKDCCDECPGLWSDGSELLAASIPSRTGGTRVSDPPEEEPREAFVERRQRLLAAAESPRTVAATGVARLRKLAVTEVADDDLIDAETDPLELADAGSVQRRGRAGTAVGRAVHAVLQLVDLESGTGLAALASSQAIAEGVPDREREILQLAQVALASDLVRQAVESGRYWREVYLGVPAGERVLEGFIDLLFETAEGLYIVDYKTDRIRDAEDARAKAARYRLQGASYARAAESVLGKKVAGCYFLFLQPSGAIAEPLTNLDEAMTEVDTLLAYSGA